ncbi:MAG TPA: APC family permease [Acidimicrobiia bacterium]|nr:APC family permease [Acidimicrobiia bacterium]
MALPVFASDPLSSVAYASEEAMLVLALAGAGALGFLTPISLAISGLLAIVVISYRQTIRAYPGGGGAFIVANENLGLVPGVTAASALLTDYTLTVAVSVAAGVAAITSAAPALLPVRVPIALAFVALVTVANLRGAREASTMFAIPTYAFVTTVFTMLIFGFLECADGACPQAISAGEELAPLSGVTALLILRAFASGSTALTGVEAVADGVQAFRKPKAKNAARTLGIMGVISITMFLGISTLARLFEVRISDETVDTYGTVISQIGRAAFGGGVGFWLLQVFTAGILILAANTAYQDFPRLSAILAQHKLMPRQFRNLGDRLVFSNGVIVLATVAAVLIWIFDAQVSRLIQLYVVGVFLSFTLSQTGMVRRWLRIKERGWQRSALLSGIGAVVTAVVLVVIASVKFVHGAWIVIAAIPLIAATMLAIRRHYLAVADRLRLVGEPPVPEANRVIVLASHTGRATQRAIEYAELIQPESLKVIHVRESGDEDLVDTWDRLYPDQPLHIVESTRPKPIRTLRDFVRHESENHPNAFTTVIIPEVFRKRRLGSQVIHPHGLLLKILLLFLDQVVVTDMTYQRQKGLRGEAQRFTDRIRNQHVVVLVADITIPVRRAMAYVSMLHADSVIAAHLDTDADQRNRVLTTWDPDYGELQILESPYRGITRPMVRYVRRLRRDAEPGTLIHIVIPEFVVPGYRSQLLHNQTALAIKAALLFEPGVAVSSVPWHLASAEAHPEAEAGEKVEPAGIRSNPHT